MPSSSRSDSVKTPKLDSDSFVAFDHAAAGHDGVRCTLSGSFIAKPCTPQEVSFYESSALHPAFRAFMPTYIGTLTSADQQQPLAVAASQQPGAIVLAPSDSSSTSDTPAPAATPQPPSQTPAAAEFASASTATQDTPWVPSGGKKLETGLSIVLENVASGFKRPNVLDVKLGARLWADDAPLSKRAKLDAVSTETTSSSLGFRIAGMKVWTGVDGETDEGAKTDPYATKYEAGEGARGEVIEKDGYRRYDKWYGRSFQAENVREGFETFLAGAKAGSADRSKMVAHRLADALRKVQHVLEAEESRMYSSSVLIVYEGDPEAMEHALEEEKKAAENPPEEGGDDDDEEEDFDLQLQPDGSFQVVDLPIGQDGAPQQAINISIDPGTAQLADLEDEEEEDPPKVHDLRLIDFAHADWTPGQGPDENVLKGVRSLVKLFDELAAE
ncbi:SAICAR synthase-like protein [Aspergillus ambiguus]|uniref:inositol polyphosphate multikinase n=1 Tax=Aspergillus ambiguus TaxID=176160 RepID=UPI003CCCE522